MTTAVMSRGAEILRHDRVAAWAEYLHATQNQGEIRYEEVEPWAWVKLQAQLRAIDARARALSKRRREEDDGA